MYGKNIFGSSLYGQVGGGGIPIAGAVSISANTTVTATLKRLPVAGTVNVTGTSNAKVRRLSPMDASTTVRIKTYSRVDAALKYTSYKVLIINNTGGSLGSNWNTVLQTFKHRITTVAQTAYATIDPNSFDVFLVGTITTLDPGLAAWLQSAGKPTIIGYQSTDLTLAKAFGLVRSTDVAGVVSTSTLNVQEVHDITQGLSGNIPFFTSSSAVSYIDIQAAGSGPLKGSKLVSWTSGSQYVGSATLDKGEAGFNGYKHASRVIWAGWLNTGGSITTGNTMVNNLLGNMLTWVGFPVYTGSVDSRSAKATLRVDSTYIQDPDPYRLRARITRPKARLVVGGQRSMHIAYIYNSGTVSTGLTNFNNAIAGSGYIVTAYSETTITAQALADSDVVVLAGYTASTPMNELLKASGKPLIVGAYYTANDTGDPNQSSASVTLGLGLATQTVPVDTTAAIVQDNTHPIMAGQIVGATLTLLAASGRMRYYNTTAAGMFDKSLMCYTSTSFSSMMNILEAGTETLTGYKHPSRIAYVGWLYGNAAYTTAAATMLKNTISWIAQPSVVHTAEVSINAKASGRAGLSTGSVRVKLKGRATVVPYATPQLLLRSNMFSTSVPVSNVVDYAPKFNIQGSDSTSGGYSVKGSSTYVSSNATGPWSSLGYWEIRDAAGTAGSAVYVPLNISAQPGVTVFNSQYTVPLARLYQSFVMFNYRTFRFTWKMHDTGMIVEIEQVSDIDSPIAFSIRWVATTRHTLQQSAAVPTQGIVTTPSDKFQGNLYTRWFDQAGQDQDSAVAQGTYTLVPFSLDAVSSNPLNETITYTSTNSVAANSVSLKRGATIFYTWGYSTVRDVQDFINNNLRVTSDKTGFPTKNLIATRASVRATPFVTTRQGRGTLTYRGTFDRSAGTQLKDMSATTSVTSAVDGSGINLTGKYFTDFLSDAFDNWGYFELTSVDKSIRTSIPFTTINGATGTVVSEDFTHNGDVFALYHGHLVNGVWAFRIVPKAGTATKQYLIRMGGGYGSDSSTAHGSGTVPVNIGSNTYNLWYNWNDDAAANSGDPVMVNMMFPDDVTLINTPSSVYYNTSDQNTIVTPATDKGMTCYLFAGVANTNSSDRLQVVTSAASWLSNDIVLDAPVWLGYTDIKPSAVVTASLSGITRVFGAAALSAGASVSADLYLVPGTVNVITGATSIIGQVASVVSLIQLVTVTAQVSLVTGVIVTPSGVAVVQGSINGSASATVTPTLTKLSYNGSVIISTAATLGVKGGLSPVGSVVVSGKATVTPSGIIKGQVLGSVSISGRAVTAVTAQSKSNTMSVGISAKATVAPTLYTIPRVFGATTISAKATVTPTGTGVIFIRGATGISTAAAASAVATMVRVASTNISGKATVTISMDGAKLGSTTVSGKVTVSVTAQAKQTIITASVSLATYADVTARIEQGVNVEFMPMGVYYLSDWKVASQNIELDIVAYDRLYILGEEDVPQLRLTQNTTVYNMFEQLLIALGLTEDEYEIDDTLTQPVAYGWYGADKVRDVLQQLTVAGNCTVNMGRTGKVSVKSNIINALPNVTWKDDETVLSIDNPQRYNSAYSKVAIKVYSPSITSSQTVLTLDNATMSAGTNSFIRIPFDTTPVVDVQQVKLKNAVRSTLTSFSYGANDCTFVIENTGDSPEDVTLIVEGRTLNLPKQTVTVVDETALEDFDKTLEIDNQLIQSSLYVSTYAQSVLQYVADPLKVLTLELRGDPSVELKDVVTIDNPTDFVEDTNVVLYRHKIVYDGSLSASAETYKV